MLKPGETGVIGGLIDRNDSKAITGTPILSNIPVLGSLFKSRSFQKGETELMIFVTPTVEEVPASSGAISAAERAPMLPQLPTPSAIGTTTATSTTGR